MNIKLKNTSNRSRTTVVTVTTPKDLAVDYGTECSFLANNKTYRAVKSKVEGNKAVFRIQVSMQGQEEMLGTLSRVQTANPEQYIWHAWTSDDWQALVPDIGVEMSNTIDYNCSILQFKLMEVSPLHQRYFIRKRHNSTNLIFEYWADINIKDPIIQFWGKIVWSDRVDTRPSKTFEAIYLRCGEYMSIDFAKRNGLTEPVRMQGKWITCLGRNIGFNDGSGLPISGRQLTFISSALQAPPAYSAELQKDLDTLKAAGEGPVVGIFMNWDGYWLAAKNAPRIASGPSETTLANNAWEEFKSDMSTTAGWYTTRRLGIGKDPGATGDQEDFGATKGLLAVTGKDPKQIYVYQYNVYADVFRGFMFYEADGTPLKASAHHNWTTWSGATHYHTAVSPDRIGKDPQLAEPVPVTGFWGYDEEHRSQNNLCAYLMLTDDPLALDIMYHIVNTDMACYRMSYPGYGRGAARAQGRCISTFANMRTVAPLDLQEKLDALMKNIWDGVATIGSFVPSKLVPVLGNHGPDGRKPIKDAAGNLLPTWSIWEHALALVGFYNAYKVARPNQVYTDYIIRLARTIAANGCFSTEIAGALTWYTVDDMWYNNNGDTLVPHSSGMMTTSNGSGVGSWTVAALMVAAELLPETDPLKIKARDCVRYFTRGASSKFEAEWWAAVRPEIYSS